MRKSLSLRALVEGAMLVAVGILLSYVKMFDMPLGGSVTAASMLPVVLYAVRWGTVPGLIAGFVYGTLQGLLGSFVAVTVWSFLLDYGFAFMMLGFAGLCYRRQSGLIWGGLIAGVGRFVIHYIAGVTVWAQYTPAGKSMWVHSLLYNGWYMLPETLIVMAVGAMLMVPLKKYITGGDLPS